MTHTKHFVDEECRLTPIDCVRIFNNRSAFRRCYNFVTSIKFIRLQLKEYGSSRVHGRTRARARTRTHIILPFPLSCARIISEIYINYY